MPCGSATVRLMMKLIVNNLVWILPVIALVVALTYAFWWRDRPKADGGITGDYEQAAERASDAGVPLLIAVDNSPG